MLDAPPWDRDFALSSFQIGPIGRPDNDAIKATVAQNDVISGAVTRPDNDAIKAAVAQNEAVPGAEVRRGTHLRVA